MKTALVHEWLVTMGGSEKVLEAIYEEYPSPVYTLVADREALSESPLAEARIHTSFVQRLPFSVRRYRNYLGFFPRAVEAFDLSEYEVVISSSHCAAKGVLTRTDQLHICYCYSPMRYAWDLYHQYLREAGLQSGIRSCLARRVLHKVRTWDVVSANRVDYFVTISKYIADRIRHVYRREAEVIYPPVDVDRFELCSEKEDYYVTASRMVPYKMMGLIVRAFTRMPSRKLVVIGDGPELKSVKAAAGGNIEILGYQPFEVLKEHLQKARAFVFAAEEDFGILPLEAQACGTPVIAFGRGGALETVINEKSGIFFYEQNERSIVDAVERFEKIENRFKPDTVKKNADRFGRDRFKREFRESVEEKIAARFG